ncbi:hypothetical protein BABINDRAFT_160483 [Babjeviella inositovora NRRL Y-12698]|uniref:Uncharacterized protein n=1 Tax=Babjeviella inositovora NRRL Y-12698 TaxID=984486 RepID=A0A1E3QTS3_9ASCO|nr:uncharacterized protein BABINDRAFT_160483 [Babjeviella inositovora NRRL Y-12698]ODQ81070.1 hypothetical protein BABINDRAFT_160483 [Babjeviella inositovora NRRL Y-12698]
MSVSSVRSEVKITTPPLLKVALRPVTPPKTAAERDTVPSTPGQAKKDVLPNTPTHTKRERSPDAESAGIRDSYTSPRSAITSPRAHDLETPRTPRNFRRDDKSIYFTPKPLAVPKSPEQLSDISNQLKTRLSYAFVKVQKGWQDKTLDDIESDKLDGRRKSDAKTYETFWRARRASGGSLLSPPLSSDQSDKSPARLLGSPTFSSVKSSHAMPPLLDDGSAHNALAAALNRQQKKQISAANGVDRDPQTPKKIRKKNSFVGSQSDEHEAVLSLMSLSSPQKLAPSRSVLTPPSFNGKQPFTLPPVGPTMSMLQGSPGRRGISDHDTDVDEDLTDVETEPEHMSE